VRRQENACPNATVGRIEAPAAEGYDERSHDLQGVIEDVTHEDARRLLARIGLTRVCDLDLLMFFARHSHALLASESLARFLGHDLQDIADSLEVLMAAGLLTRVQTPAHAARLYVFAPNETSDDWLPPLIELASTREGRLALRRDLRTRREGAAERRRPGTSDSMAKRGPRHIVGSSGRRTGTD